MRGEAFKTQRSGIVNLADNFIRVILKRRDAKARQGIQELSPGNSGGLGGLGLGDETHLVPLSPPPTASRPQSYPGLAAAQRKYSEVIRLKLLLCPYSTSTELCPSYIIMDILLGIVKFKTWTQFAIHHILAHTVGIGRGKSSMHVRVDAPDSNSHL